MYALRGREKRKILSVGAPHEGETTGWGYGLGGGLHPPSETSLRMPCEPQDVAGLGPEGAIRSRAGKAALESAHHIVSAVHSIARWAPRRGPAARRRPRAAREAYSLYVPLGGGLRPPSETSPQDSLRRQSRRSKVEHFHVGRQATDEDSHGPPLNVPLRARASPAQPSPGGGFGGGRRGPLR